MNGRSALLLTLLLAVTGCDGERHTSYQGYVEGEYLYMAAPEAGWITEVAVRKGEMVVAGAPLFRLEESRERAAVAEAKARLTQAEAQRADQLLGRRPDEIAQIEARLAQAEASRVYMEAELRRQRELAKRDVAAKSQLDLASSRARESEAAVAAMRAELATARLPARPDQLAAADAAVAAARAALDQAEWRLGQRRVSAPEAARVEDVPRRPGEWVPANGVVVSLLPPDRLKLVLFVPEPNRSQVRPGDRLAISCSGCPAGLTARVRFVAAAAEYTPPVIYSLETRSKLVYRVEADPEGAARSLTPGQPVDLQPITEGG